MVQNGFDKLFPSFLEFNTKDGLSLERFDFTFKYIVDLS